MRRPIARSQGSRSASVRGVPEAIFATLPDEWRTSPSSVGQPTRSASAAMTADLPAPATPIRTMVMGLRRRGDITSGLGLELLELVPGHGGAVEADDRLGRLCRVRREDRAGVLETVALGVVDAPDRELHARRDRGADADLADPVERAALAQARVGSLLERGRLDHDVGQDPRVDALERRREAALRLPESRLGTDRKSTRLNSSHLGISYAVFCLKKN